MKKISKIIILVICLLCIFVVPVKAKEDKVKFSSCVDGDTIKVEIKGEIKTVRFLAIDTPETKHPKKKEEPFGKEASNYTCDKVTNAKKIVLEYDNNSDSEDKYGRLLAWVWVDDSLLQKELVNKGLAKVAYLYDDYKYTNDLQKVEKVAQSKNIGIWQDTKEESNDISIITIIIIVIVIIIILLVPKYRKKAIKKAKKEAKKELNKYIDKVLK